MRERFLRAVEHRPEDHIPGQRIPPEVHASFDKKPWLRAIATTAPADCDLWWCLEPHEVKLQQWADLEKAAQALRQHGRELHGEEAAQILCAHRGVELWKAQAKDLEALASAIEIVPLDRGGDAEALRGEFMTRLEPLLNAARSAAPKRARMGPPSDVAFTRACEVAERLGWGPEDIAAVFLLAGIDKSEWKSLQDKVAKKAKQRRKSVKSPS